MSDLQRRTEALLRGKGYLTASVERRKRFPAKGKPPCRACGHVLMVDISEDLWNVFDLIAIHINNQGQMVFVQVTSSSNHADRRNKIIASAEAKLSILCGHRILIQSWRKKDNRWQAHDEWISIDQFVTGLPDTVEEFYEDQKRLALLKRQSRGLPPHKQLPVSPYLKDEEMEF